jgi:hypothetical protein
VINRAGDVPIATMVSVHARDHGDIILSLVSG